MFDLDAIEKDWKDNSFSLSEDEIIEIYKSEGVTIKKYEEELEKYRKKTHVDISPEERLFACVFNDSKITKKIEQERILKEKNEFPKRKRLSKESQRKVVEGCLYMVFDSTRYWYNFFDNRIDIEQLYYICLEALMNAVKYIMHSEKPGFRFYVSKGIERNIIKHVALWEHITYREAYRIIKNLDSDYDLKEQDKNKELSLIFVEEEVRKPTAIFYQLKNERYDVDYISNISSDEFMMDYNQSLENLDDVAKMIMQFSFNDNGERGLTSRKIGEYLGIKPQKVSNIRRNAIKVLKKNPNLNMYRH